VSDRESLALKYRPATFGDVAGQLSSVAVLYRMCKLGTVPSGILLYGEPGCGKTSVARIIARALGCEAEPGAAASWPCGACASCKAVADGTSTDVEELDAASNGTVEQIRAVRERAWYGTADGHRAFIIDEAHGLSGPAFEALLTILEAPPPGVVFILVTTQPASIPRTIRSRLSPFRFSPLPPPVIQARLEKVCRAEGFAAEEGLLAAIAEAAHGGMRDALVLLDQMASARITRLSLWREMTGETDFAPVLLAAAGAGDYPALYAALDGALASLGDPGHVARELVRCLRDLLVLGCGAGVSAQGEALAARQELAARLGAARVNRAMLAMWDLQVRVRVDDREAGLVLAVSAVARCLCPQALEEAQPIARDGSAAAPYAEIRSLLGSL
jgi:DNA polymerase III subunit gamma/tau